MSDALDDILAPIHDNGQDVLALCGYQAGRHPRPHTCGLPEAKAAIQDLFYTEVLGLIGPDNGFVACDDLHEDAYKVQPRIKAYLRAKAKAKWGKL